jgi:hypothetical protein
MGEKFLLAEEKREDHGSQFQMSRSEGGSPVFLKKET